MKVCQRCTSSTELALTWAITDNLLIDYAYTYTDTEVTEVPDPALVSNYPGAIRRGGKLYNYSPETHNIGVNWNRDNVISGWDMYASANYVTRDRVDGINPFRAPDAYVPARDRYQNLIQAARLCVPLLFHPAAMPRTQ